MWALAAQMMGWRTVSFCEKERFCQQVLRSRFTNIPIFPDIFKTNYGSIKSFYRKAGIKRGRIDIVTMSTPCQPFSVAGSQKGSGDDRHLFSEGVRLISEIRPRWVVIENVRNLLSIESGRVFEEYHSRLESEGYSVQTFSVPASAVNAPHRRDRLWIVGNADRQRLSARQLRNRTQRSQPPSPAGKMDVVDAALRNIQSGIYSDTDDKRCDGRNEQNQSQKWQIFTGRGDDRAFGEPAIRDSRIAGIITDTDASRRQEQRQSFAGESQIAGDNFREITEIIGDERWGSHWLEAAITLCGMDDGLPAWLDDAERRGVYKGVEYFGWQEISRKVGFDCRKVENFLHRTNRLKALGNAIVWLIAFEIFKAIQQAETLYEQN